MIPREEAIQNPDKYCICRRCRNWFDPTEGTMHAPEISGPLSAIRAVESAAVGSHTRFQCSGCTHKRKVTQFVIFGTFFLLAAGVILLNYLGVIA